MKPVTLVAAVFLASLAAIAHAGQHFWFSNPISTSDASYSDAMYETSSLYSDYHSGAASFQNMFTGDVTLTVDDFNSVGGYMGSKSVTAEYFIAQTNARTNDQFVGTITSNVYATGAGWATFVNPADPSQTYLQVAFSKSILAYGSFAASENLAFSGSLFDSNETGNANASFGFLDSFGTGKVTHHTGTFSASIGTIGTIQATPEPAPIATLATGVFILLRRRRRG